MAEINNQQKNAINEALFFAQMEKYLLQQINRCEYYKKSFEDQSNVTMANRFAAYSETTAKDLALLRDSWQNNQELPKFKFDYINFNCLPTDVEVKEKELQLLVRTSGLSENPNNLIYIVGEFEFSVPTDEPFNIAVNRWLHSVKIEPRNLICCSGSNQKQLDIIYSTDTIPFTNPSSDMTEYDRPLTFFVDKGRSRTLKRKYKPIKLTFYEKTGFLKCDKRLGTALVRIDTINDEILTVSRLQIMDGRKTTNAVADIKIKVREPLVNKSIRAHEEKLLLIIS